jgi:signal peptidase I
MTQDSKTLNAGENADAPEGLTLKQKILAEIKFFAGLITFVVAMMTLVWGHFKIPSESMLPTLEVGDHLYVSKFAYGYSRHSLPFVLHKLPLPDGQIFSRLPKRGDVAVFRNPKSGQIMIKRVIGLPGDRVKVIDGQLYLNGEEITRQPVTNFLYREHKGRVVGVDVYQEQLPGEKESHLIYEQTDQGILDNTETFIVPNSHIFFMGDNRDNSTDSRAPEGPGFVPQENLMGRADLMMFSFKRCAKEEGLRCPPRRFAKGL